MRNREYCIFLDIGVLDIVASLTRVGYIARNGMISMSWDRVHNFFPDALLGWPVMLPAQLAYSSGT